MVKVRGLNYGNGERDNREIICDPVLGKFRLFFFPPFHFPFKKMIKIYKRQERLGKTLEGEG